MFEDFRKYLEQKISLSGADYELIESVSIIKKLRKHQYLLQEGDVWRYNAFVCKGCLRKYRVDDKGVEHILYFSIENWWTGDRESLLNGTPSKSNIDALEDSSVLLISTGNFEMIKNKLPAFRDLMNTLIERSFAASQNRIHSAISQTAEERYFDFIKTYPQIATAFPST
ncbi:MAG: cyclic nucleotide-binding domain-containing protein [Bacteroidota bacterium]